MNKIRLQKYIAQSGILSRRKAEELIRQGRVELNGEILFEPWFPVSSGDCVKVDGKVITSESKKVYIMLNKPEGYVSTVKDQFSRKTVLDLVNEVKERIYPVGRLDYDTSGLLLLTNDGEFTYKLTHPKYEIKKIYIAEITGIPSIKEIREFENGLCIDSIKTSVAKFKILKRRKNSCIVEITIHEGRNRQVRRMCGAIGHPVIKLKRIAVGNINLGNLPEGKWRYLTNAEIKKLLQ